MKYSELLNMLDPPYALKSLYIVRDVDISDVFLLDSSLGEYSDNTLYIGQMSQLRESPVAPLNFLYWGEPPSHGAFLNSNHAEIEPNDFPAVFNRLKQKFTNALKEKSEYADMLTMILNGKSLSAILDAATQRTQNAFVVLDISGKLLAHSTFFDVNDPLWIRSVTDGYCSYEFMNHIKQIRFKKASPKTPEAFVSVCEENQTTYLCSKILSDDALLGYVFMFENGTPIDKKCREIITAISRVACELITRSQESSDLRINLYHSVMLDMLAGIDPEHANVRIQVSELSFPKQMCVLNVRPSYYCGEHYIKDVLQKRLREFIANPPPVYYKGGMVLIAPLNESRQMEPDFQEKLKELAKNEHLQIGVSNGFSNAFHLAAYYAQSEDALRFAQHENVEGDLFYYHDYAFLGLLNSLPHDLNPRQYCHPALDLLRKYDLENQMSLYQTLKAYAETGLNQHKTAEKLFLHRNTLRYRLQRIEEITGIDFKEPESLFQLMYSFKLEEFSGNEMG